MSYLPLNIQIHGMKVLVVGAGSVASRKATALVDAGAIVHVVAPVIAPSISTLADSGKVSLKQGPYETCDLHDSFLIVAATGDPDLNRSIAEEALQCGLLVSVISEPDAGNFIFPALLQRGDLTVSVSTSGTCPAYASLVRDFIADTVGEEFGAALETLAAEREKLLTEGHPSNYNSQILRALARQLLQGLVRKEYAP